MHEGPASISKRGTTVALKRGMILSNEPGYYKAGAYGIRIENLVLVTEAKIAGAEKPMNAFETLTLAPIDRRLIEPALMTADEIAWLDAYHARVADTLMPLVASDTKNVARGRHKAAPWLSRPPRRRNVTRHADIPTACWPC